MNAQEARESLNAIIRSQLAAAYQRGVDTAPHGVNALADLGAAAAYRTINIAVSDYTGAIALGWAAHDDVSRETTDQEAGT